MFKCDKCKKITVAREKQHKVVVEIRDKFYNNGSVGTEIVKEKNYCEECFTGVK